MTGHALVTPPDVTRVKFARQLAQWEANREYYARRGWILLGHGDLWVDIAMVADVPLGVHRVGVISVAFRLSYENFDMWPPSLTFIHPLTREPALPPVQALAQLESGEVRNALIEAHPETGRPFLCLPGVREYHSHPQHRGDSWLLHRASHEGDLAVICDRVWQRMVMNVVGVTASISSVIGIGWNVEMSLAQGNRAQIEAMVAAQQSQTRTPEPS
jgi:Predicted metal binding domain